VKDLNENKDKKEINKKLKTFIIQKSMVENMSFIQNNPTNDTVITIL